MNDQKKQSSGIDSIRLWVDQYGQYLYSWAYYRTSHKEIAEDLVQDTFVSALESIDTFRGQSQPKTWLIGILNHKIADYHRKKFKELYPGEFHTFPESGESGTEDFDEEGNWMKDQRPVSWEIESGHLLDNPEFTQALLACMEDLPETWFTALQSKYYEGKNGEQICQEMQISPANFWQIVHRAKLMLRKCLEINWFKK